MNSESVSPPTKALTSAMSVGSLQDALPMNTREVESLLRELVEQREGTLIEFKAFNPMSPKSPDSQIDLTAKAVVSLCNAAILRGMPSHLVLGVKDDGSFRGIRLEDGDRKIFFDRLKSRADPVPQETEFLRVNPRICSKIFGLSKNELGCYVIGFPPESYVPLRFSPTGEGDLDSSRGGTILIRSGAKIVKPDKFQLLELFAKCKGAAEAISRHRIVRGRHELTLGSKRASEVARLLHRGERRRAARLAFNLLIAERGPKLGTLIWRAPSALYFLLDQQVNPFLWYISARGRGYRLRVKEWGLDWDRKEKAWLFGKEAQAEAWEQLSTALNIAAESSGITEDKVLAGSSFQYYVARSLERVTRDLLKKRPKEPDKLPYFWFNRLMVGHPSPLAPKTPKGWKPEPLGWVDGIAFLTWEEVRPIRSTRIVVSIPVVGHSLGNMRVWWAVFSQVAVFMAVDSPSSMKWTVESSAWEREASDKFHRGEIDPKEYGLATQGQQYRIRFLHWFFIVSVFLVMILAQAFRGGLAEALIGTAALILIMSLMVWMTYSLNRRTQTLSQQIEGKSKH